MNSMSMRQKAVVAVLMVVALYAVAVLTWFLSAESAWKKAARRYNEAKQTYIKEEKLIADKARWDEEYEKEKQAMPTFEAGQATDTTWLKKMGETATRNLVNISQRSTKKEKMEIDDVTVMPIDASWEGSLEALVKFIHELENSDSGLFDMGSLDMKPSSKKGYLKGSFTLNCAYMRE